MNCQELSQDIKRLKSLRNSLKEKVDSATETGFGRIAVESVKEDITSAADQILEKYVNDFYEKNPELLHVTLGKRIDGFADANGNPAWVSSIAPIPGTDNLLIGGILGALYEYQKQQDGSYKLGKRIDGFKHASGNTTSIYSIVHIPGTDNLLIGGADGALYEYQKQQDGSYKLGKMIDGFENSDGYPTSIYSITHIPGTDNLLIGGGGGALYEACANLPSLSNLKRSLPQIINKNIQQDV